VRLNPGFSVSRRNGTPAGNQIGPPKRGIGDRDRFVARRSAIQPREMRGGGSRPDAAGTRQTEDSLPLASRRGRIPGIPTRVLNARSAPTRQFIRCGVLSFVDPPLAPSLFLSLYASSYLCLSVFSGPDRAEYGRIPRQRRGVVHGGCRSRAQ
jgi:hypothetical protein